MATSQLICIDIMLNHLTHETVHHSPTSDVIEHSECGLQG